MIKFTRIDRGAHQRTLRAGAYTVTRGRATRSRGARRASGRSRSPAFSQTSEQARRRESTFSAIAGGGGGKRCGRLRQEWLWVLRRERRFRRLRQERPLGLRGERQRRLRWIHATTHWATRARLGGPEGVRQLAVQLKVDLLEHSEAARRGRHLLLTEPVAFQLRAAFRAGRA